MSFDQFIKEYWMALGGTVGGIFGAYQWFWTQNRAVDESEHTRETETKERLWKLMDDAINRMEHKMSELRAENEERYVIEAELRKRCSLMESEMLALKSTMFKMKHDLDIVMHHHTQAEAEVGLWRDAYSKLADAFHRGRNPGAAERHVADMQKAIARALMPERTAN